MPRVLVVTDSEAHIEPATVQRLGITVVPLTIRIGDTVFRDNEGLGHEQLLLRMASKNIQPEIVGPTAEEFSRVYGELTRHTDQLISLHSAAGLSSICKQAQLAADEFLGRCDIVVVDSEAVSVGLGILVQRTAEMALGTANLTDIVREIRGLIKRVYTVMTTETLHHLEHSGLISPTQAVLGSMLGIRPFLAIEGGEIVPMEKVRGRDKAIEKMAEFAGEFASIEDLAVLQSTAYPAEGAKMLRDRLESVVQGRSYPTLLYGPLLASKIGADGLGLVVYEGTDSGWTF